MVTNFFSRQIRWQDITERNRLPCLNDTLACFFAPKKNNWILRSIVSQRKWGSFTVMRGIQDP